MVLALTGTAPMVVEFQQLPVQPTVSVHLVRSAAALPVAFNEFLPVIGKEAGQLGARFSGPPFLLYHGMIDSRLDVEIGMPVATVVQGIPRLGTVEDGQVGASSLPAGRTASWVYRGPYAGLGDAWARFNVWLSENGYTCGDRCWESYLDNPDLVAADELRTELFQGLTQV